MSGPIQKTSQGLAFTNQDHHPLSFWTPPETNPVGVTQHWKQIRETLALLKKKQKARRGSVSFYPPSLSTQAEDRLFNLDPYGIRIKHTIRRIEYGGVFADQLAFERQTSKACRYVRVNSDRIAEFVRDVVEIRDRYRSQKMFTTLVENKLLKATPLVYGDSEGGNVWRPERCFDMGGQQLEQFGWSFPVRISPPSDDIRERVAEWTHENVWTGIEDLSDHGEPLFATETCEAEQGDNTVQFLTGAQSDGENITRLTVENLRILNGMNSASESSQPGIPQMDGVLEFTSHFSDESDIDIDCGGGINTGFQDTELTKVNAGAIILSPLRDTKTRRSPVVALIHRFLSMFYLRSGRRSRGQLSNVQDSYGNRSGLTTSNLGDDDDLALGKEGGTNLDPFKEDDFKARYLSVPFQTERYHILSKRVEYPRPYNRPIDIPYHPVLRNPAVQPPWRAPSVSYWCRPVNGEHRLLRDEVATSDEEAGHEGDEGPGSDLAKEYLWSIPGLNHITAPYLSIQYADTTHAYDAWSFDRCVNTALMDLHIAMTTGVYNRYLQRGPACFNPQQESHNSGDVSPVPRNDTDYHFIGCQCRREEAEHAQHEVEQSVRHYGICIGLSGFTCWMAEPDLRWLPAQSVLSVLRGDVPRTLEEDITAAMDTSICDTGSSTTTSSGGLESEGSERGEQEKTLQWAGCKITKVMEGRVDRFMNLDGLVEFINRAHEYGMGSYVRDVSLDLGLSRGGSGAGDENDGSSESESESDSDDEYDVDDGGGGNEGYHGDHTSTTTLCQDVVEDVDDAGPDELDGVHDEDEENGDGSEEGGERDGDELGDGSDHDENEDGSTSGDEGFGGYAGETGGFDTGNQGALWIDGTAEPTSSRDGEVTSSEWDRWDEHASTQCGDEGDQMW